MAETVVSFVLKELTMFMVKQHGLLGAEVERDFQFLIDELGSMRAFLRDAESQADEAAEIEEWVNQVRELAYDVEDVVDHFSLRLGDHHHRGHMFDSVRTMKARRWMSTKMKTLKARVVDASERHKRYGGIQGSCSVPAASLEDGIRSNSILVQESELVGIDSAKTDLISQILAEEDSYRKVTAVVGMGGLGKTTLVKKVYDDASVKKWFQIHVWITVSQSFEILRIIKELMLQMLKEAGEPGVELVDDILSLSSLVMEFLRDRSYIIVLDDVWTDGLWEAIKNVFPNGKSGRVVLTTRLADVASAACSGSIHDHVYKMAPLSEDDSWTLFCSTAFRGTLSCPPPHLHEVCANILRKCEGLPLAIGAIAGVLSYKNAAEWDMILHSLGKSDDVGNGKLDRLNRILLLSYDELPHYLKACFLYLSIYPEDFRIPRNLVVQNLVAEGLVEKKQGMTAYDVANSYIFQLVNRGLLQPESFTNGTIQYFRVHDILRDLIVLKSSKQNFFAVAQGCYSGQRSNKLRRLQIHDYVDNSEEQHCFKSLRALEFNGDNSRLSGPLLSKFLTRGTKLLRVLSASNALSLEHMPKEVFGLYNLRRLCFRGSNVSALPKSIGKLKNLEVLDLCGTKVREIPVETFKLAKLTYLWVVFRPAQKHYIGFKCPDGIGNLVCLESLIMMDAGSSQIVGEIGKLVNLKGLSITDVRREDGKDLCFSLSTLTNLRHLLVQSGADQALDLDHLLSPAPKLLNWLELRGGMVRMPEWVKSLQNLAILELTDSGLKEDGDCLTTAIQDLPNLLELNLDRAYDGQTLHFRAGGFLKLEKLHLKGLERLQLILAEDESLPSLEVFCMTSCKLVEELPLSSEYLKKLKSLVLLDMSNGFVRNFQNLDPASHEYEALACIPKFRFRYLDKGRYHSMEQPIHSAPHPYDTTSLDEEVNHGILDSGLIESPLSQCAQETLQARNPHSATAETQNLDHGVMNPISQSLEYTTECGIYPSHPRLSRQDPVVYSFYVGWQSCAYFFLFSVVIICYVCTLSS